MLGYLFDETRTKCSGVVQQGRLPAVLQFERAALSAQNRLGEGAKQRALDSTVPLSRLSVTVLELGSPQIKCTSDVYDRFVGFFFATGEFMTR
jgi:hypothetical protein